MNGQRSLWDTSPQAFGEHGFPIESDGAAKTIARRTDPQTSKDAAANVAVNRCEVIFLETLKRIGGRATAYAVGELSGYQFAETIRKRAGGLKHRRLICVAGYGKHPETGNKVESFMLAAAGHAFLEQANARHSRIFD